MVKKSVRETVFFVLVFLLFLIATFAANRWSQSGSYDSNMIYGIVGVVYTLVIVGIFFLVKMHSKEGFWDITPAALCKGGPYFWQGDSETAKMCRQMASTPEGIIAMSSYNCPTGYVGQPGREFVYTPLSGDYWENERCEDPKRCPLVNQGMCSLHAQL